MQIFWPKLFAKCWQNYDKFAKSPSQKNCLSFKGLLGHKIVGTYLSRKVKLGVSKESSFAVWTSVNEEVLQMKQSEVEIGEYIVK